MYHLLDQSKSTIHQLQDNMQTILEEYSLQENKIEVQSIGMAELQNQRREMVHAMDRVRHRLETIIWYLDNGGGHKIRDVVHGALQDIIKYREDEEN